jgi:hypothetical protein
VYLLLPPSVKWQGRGESTFLPFSSSADHSPSQANPIFQLQVLFAFLEKSTQGVYDPSPLITSLKLDTSEQQDAQEFSKLFLAVLDREFKKQGKRAEAEGGDGSAATLVEDNFEGKMVYLTKCRQCGTTSERPSIFNELELNLAVSTSFQYESEEQH